MDSWCTSKIEQPSPTRQSWIGSTPIRLADHEVAANTLLHAPTDLATENPQDFANLLLNAPTLSRSPDSFNVSNLSWGNNLDLETSLIYPEEPSLFQTLPTVINQHPQLTMQYDTGQNKRLEQEKFPLAGFEKEHSMFPEDKLTWMMNDTTDQKPGGDPEWFADLQNTDLSTLNIDAIFKELPEAAISHSMSPECDFKSKRVADEPPTIAPRKKRARHNVPEHHDGSIQRQMESKSMNYSCLIATELNFKELRQQYLRHKVPDGLVGIEADFTFPITDHDKVIYVGQMFDAITNFDAYIEQKTEERIVRAKREERLHRTHKAEIPEQMDRRTELDSIVKYQLSDFEIELLCWETLVSWKLIVLYIRRLYR
jgi:hypothetical protein